jgi:hypothetical protein
MYTIMAVFLLINSLILLVGSLWTLIGNLKEGPPHKRN